MNYEPIPSLGGICIEGWKPDATSLKNDIEMLSELLEACVQAGASVSFVLPFSRSDAAAFWRDQVLPAVMGGSRYVLLARSGGSILGTVQLDIATPPNQPHRAEIKKLLVHPEARRCGIGRSLMNGIEVYARKAGRSLLTLDTVSNGAAEPLYLSLGYVAIGRIPCYAFNFDSSALEPTTVMYKQLI